MPDVAEKVHFIKADFSDANALTKAIVPGGIVIHLAGTSNQATAEKDPSHGDNRAMSTWPSSDDDLLILGQQAVAQSGGSISSYDVAFNQLTLSGPAGQAVAALR